VNSVKEGRQLVDPKFIDARLDVFVQHEVNEREMFGL